MSMATKPRMAIKSVPIPAASFMPSQAPSMMAAMKLECTPLPSAGTFPIVRGSPVSGIMVLVIITDAGTERIEAEIKCPAMEGNASLRNDT